MRQVPDWATDPAFSSKFDRNSVEVPRYADIESSFSRDAKRMVHTFLEGDTTKPQLLQQFKGRLQQAETEAFVAGRRARGDLRDTLTDDEAQMLEGRHSRNMRYFNRFATDMENGTGRMDYSDRVDLYAKSMWSLYTRGETSDWQDPENKNARYYWVLDPYAEHCKTCLERAEKSRDQDGFSWEELSEIGWPGEHTICQVNCRCHIRVVHKKIVLPERFDEMQEARSATDGLQTLQDLMGGEQLPLRLPAAGVPNAKLDPSILDYSLDNTPAPDTLAKRLPLLPKLLTQPEDVFDSGDRRIYVGHGLEATLARDEKGLWTILALILSSAREGKVA